MEEIYNNTSQEETTSRSIRFPVSVLERIKLLAHKRRWSVNKWVVITCERESKPKINSSTSGGVVSE